MMLLRLPDTTPPENLYNYAGYAIIFLLLSLIRLNRKSKLEKLKPSELPNIEGIRFQGSLGMKILSIIFCLLAACLFPLVLQERDGRPEWIMLFTLLGLMLLLATYAFGIYVKVEQEVMIARYFPGIVRRTPLADIAAARFCPDTRTTVVTTITGKKFRLPVALAQQEPLRLMLGKIIDARPHPPHAQAFHFPRRIGNGGEFDL